MVWPLPHPKKSPGLCDNWNAAVPGPALFMNPSIKMILKSLHVPGSPWPMLCSENWLYRRSNGIRTCCSSDYRIMRAAYKKECNHSHLRMCPTWAIMLFNTLFTKPEVRPEFRLWKYSKSFCHNDLNQFSTSQYWKSTTSKIKKICLIYMRTHGRRKNVSRHPLHAILSRIFSSDNYLNFPLVLQKSPKKRGFDGKCSKYYLELIFYWYAWFNMKYGVLCSSYVYAEDHL